VVSGGCVWTSQNLIHAYPKHLYSLQNNDADFVFEFERKERGEFWKKKKEVSGRNIVH